MGAEAVAVAPAAPQAAEPTQEQAEQSPNAADVVAKDDAKQPSRGADGKFASTKPPEPEKPKTAREKLLEMVDEDGNVTLKLRGKPVKMPFERAVQEMEVDYAGKQRWTEVDKRAKEMEAREARLKDPSQLAQVLQEIGHDPIKFADSILGQFIQRQKMEQELTPEQRAHLTLQQERQQLERERQEWMQQQEQLQIQEATKANEAILVQHVPQQFEAMGLPKDSPTAVETFKTYLSRAVAAGIPISPETVKYAAENTKAELQGIVHGLGKELKGKALLEFVGPDMLNAIRRADLEEYEASKNVAPPPPPQIQSPAAPKNGRPQYVDEKSLTAQLRKNGFFD